MAFRRAFVILNRLPMFLTMALVLIVPSAFNSAFAQSTYTVQPQGTLNLFAYCVNQYGQFVTPCAVGVYPAYYEFTGGHYHNVLPRPTFSLGTVSPTSGLYTDYQGLPVTYTASKVGQQEAVFACANYCGHANIDVKYSDISAYLGSSTSQFIGSTSWHNANHFGTSFLNNKVTSITQTYHNRYSCRSDYQIVGLNDMALQWGGVFDVCPVAAAGCKNTDQTPKVKQWEPPHSWHHRGKAADFRADPNKPNHIINNAVIIQDFINICIANGLTFAQHEDAGTGNSHVHCSTPGGN
jgi:hypothetical protein